MPTSILKSQNTSDNLDNLYIDDWKKNRRKIEIDTLYLIFHNLQRLDWGPTRFRKQSQCNKPSFYFLVRL